MFWINFILWDNKLGMIFRNIGQQSFNVRSVVVVLGEMMVVIFKGLQPIDNWWQMGTIIWLCHENNLTTKGIPLLFYHSANSPFITPLREFPFYFTTKGHITRGNLSLYFTASDYRTLGKWLWLKFMQSIQINHPIILSQVVLTIISSLKIIGGPFGD